MHNATWGKHRHFYDCIFMIFTLQLENYNCKMHSLAKPNILLHLIQIWSGIWIKKQIASQLSSIFLIMCRTNRSVEMICYFFLSIVYFICLSQNGYPWSKLSFFLSKQLTTKKMFSFVVKVHIFWEGPKTLRNSHLTFDHSTQSQK